MDGCSKMKLTGIRGQSNIEGNDIADVPAKTAAAVEGHVWLGFATVSCLMTILIVFFKRVNCTSKEVNPGPKWGIRGSFKSRSQSVLVLVLTWSLTAFVFVNVYSSLVVSFLSTTNLLPVVDSLSDVARNVNKFPLYTLKNSYGEIAIMNTKSGDLKVTGDYLRTQDVLNCNHQVFYIMNRIECATDTGLIMKWVKGFYRHAEKCLEHKNKEVRNVIQYAKLTEKELKKESYVLDLSSSMMDKKQYKLFEVTKPLLEYLNRGESLIIRGLEDDSAVVCTNDNTYDVKEAETSNSILLMPLLKDARVVEEDDKRTLLQQTVAGIYHTYFELKPLRPKLQRLRSLLREHAYRGRDSDDVEKTGLGFSDLKEMIQMSESELLESLSSIDAIKMNGKWRLLDIQLQYKWLTKVIQHTNGEACLTEDRVLKVTQGFETPQINSHLMNMYLEGAEDNLSFNAEKITGLFATCLFSHSKEYVLEEFTKVMDEVLPIGIDFRPEILRGMALVDETERPVKIVHLPEHSLPEDINDRLQVLFRKKAKWTLDEMTPYIKPLTLGNQNITGILTKYSRSFTQNGVKFYGAKYANQ
nr:EOG090X09TV [Eulimnadia texana]